MEERSYFNPIAWKFDVWIALITVSFSHLHYNVIQRGCKAVLGKLNYKIARTCLTYMLDFIEMQMSKAKHKKRAIASHAWLISLCIMQMSRVNREKGFSSVKYHSLSPCDLWQLSGFFLLSKAVFTHSWIEELDHKAKEKLPGLRFRCGFFDKCFFEWLRNCEPCSTPRRN